jgi:prepilin-type N-terminal cleavage/methylation domain-containing protein
MMTDNKRKGFTLIELLIVVVIIGILATIAIPKFAATKEKAVVAKMKGDLRNLATAQESYITDNASYYLGPVPTPALVYNPSSGILVTITAVVPGGWAATATAPGLSSITCGLFVGAAPPAPPAVTEGQVRCS